MGACVSAPNEKPTKKRTAKPAKTYRYDQYSEKQEKC